MATKYISEENLRRFKQLMMDEVNLSSNIYFDNHTYEKGSSIEPLVKALKDYILTIEDVPPVVSEGTAINYWGSIGQDFQVSTATSYWEELNEGG